MSDRKELYGGIIVDVAEESYDRVSKMLAGIPGGAKKAIGHALSRAASAGKTNIKRSVTKEYTISQDTFMKNTRNMNHFVRNSEGGYEVVFGFAGNVIPLMRFDTMATPSGLVSSRVKTSSPREILENAFVAKMGTHTGIYERLGIDRFPVKELFGPATPQMMYSNEEVLDDMEARMVEVYEQRIDHEIMRILNGWGK